MAGVVVVLGRRLLAAPVATTATAAKDAEIDAALSKIQLDDRFFCDTMELIPAQFYFPTDEEENWKKSAPKANKKYHRDVLANKQQESSKKAHKRAKFNPTEQKTNEERQLETADEEKKQKQVKAPLLKVEMAKDPSAVSIDGLRERLATKLALMREQRNADDKNGKKRKANANAKGAAAAATEPASKKRKAATGAAFNNKAGGKKQEENGAKENGKTESNESAQAEVEVSASSISYGSLLLADENKVEKKKTRNGMAVRGIQNLLKKAERNQQRMEELKKTEEGKALVQSQNWNKALKQAAGEVVLDDPKLLRKKLKKKEKTKAKSAKEWKKRTSQLEISKKERQKKRLENIRTGGAASKEKKEGNKPIGRTGPRAGFEGKKGEGFLNAEKGGKKK